MIYLDTSVVLARLFAEDRSTPDGLWSQTLVASRLLEFEVFNRLHARGAAASHGEGARRHVDRVNLVEMSATVLGPAFNARISRLTCATEGPHPAASAGPLAFNRSRAAGPGPRW